MKRSLRLLTILLALVWLSMSGTALAQTGWVRLPAPTTRDLYDVAVLSGNRLVVVGDSGTTAMSGDRGESWQTMEVTQGRGERALLNRVAISPDGTIYAAGELRRGESIDSSEPLLIRSAGAGLDWTRVPMSSLGVTGGLLNDLEVTSGGIVTAAGRDSLIRSMLLRSTDDGETWTRTWTGTQYSDIVALEYGDGGVGLMLEQWQPGSQIFYRIFRTADAGATWTEVPLEFPFRDAAKKEVAYAGAGTWVVTTSQSQVFRSTDDGMTWALVQPLTAYRLDFNGAVGYGAPGREHPGYPTEITLSTDAGATWQRQTFPGPASRVFSVAMADHRSAYVVGSEGAVWRTDNLGGVSAIGTPGFPSAAKGFSVVYRNDGAILIHIEPGSENRDGLAIYDLLGRLVRHADLPPLATEYLLWGDQHLRPGVYICSANGQSLVFLVNAR